MSRSITNHSTSCHLQKGFTLVEILAVLAIIVLLAVGVAPAISNIVGAKSVSQGAYEIISVLELARSEAVTRRTYVWVGFKNANVRGIDEVQVALVGSRDGSSTTTNKANQMSLSRVIHIENVSLKSWGELKPSTRNLLEETATTSTLATNTAGALFDVGPISFDTKQTITFTPRGEVLLNGNVGPNDGYDPLIDISIRQSRGGVVPANADDAAVVVDGATGMARILIL